MDGAYVVCASKVTAQQAQERAQSLGSAGGKRNEKGQLGDLAKTDAGPTRALHRRRRRLRDLRLQVVDDVLQRLSPDFRGVREQFAQLLDLLFRVRSLF